jgi:hypothetical protein
MSSTCYTIGGTVNTETTGSLNVGDHGVYSTKKYLTLQSVTYE